MGWGVSRLTRPWHAAALLVPLAALAALGCTKPPGGPAVAVGSKNFPESVLLGEIVRYLAVSAGASAEHKSGLGDTSKAWNALRVGDIDAYVEYTGTLTQEVLAAERIRDEKALRAALARRGLRMSRSLGFRNN